MEVLPEENLTVVSSRIDLKFLIEISMIICLQPPPALITLYLHDVDFIRDMESLFYIADTTTPFCRPAAQLVSRQQLTKLGTENSIRLSVDLDESASQHGLSNFRMSDICPPPKKSFPPLQISRLPVGGSSGTIIPQQKACLLALHFCKWK
jgi:hypothetical protein